MSAFLPCLKLFELVFYHLLLHGSKDLLEASRALQLCRLDYRVLFNSTTLARRLFFMLIVNTTYFLVLSRLPSAYTQRNLKSWQCRQAGRSPLHFVFLCLHGSHACVTRCLSAVADAFDRD